MNPDPSSSKDTVLANDYIVSILDSGIQVWDISRLNDLSRDGPGLTPEPPIELEPHLFLPSPWISAPFAMPTTVHHISHGSNTWILFDVAFLGIIGRPHALGRVLRYSLTLTREPPLTTIRASLVLRGAGHLRGCKRSISTWPSGGVCFDQGGKFGTNKLSWYFPPGCSLPDATPRMLYDLSSSIPVGVAGFGCGQLLGVCSLLGRAVYLRHGGDDSDETDTIICADYLY